MSERHPGRGRARWAAMLATTALLLGACTGGDDGDADPGPGSAEPSPSELASATTTTTDAPTDAASPVDGSPSEVPGSPAEPSSPDASPSAPEVAADWDCSLVDGPCVYGDDPELDVLWDGCAEGSGADCDQLFFESARGSQYEEFGDTCGGRGYEVSCEEVYGGGEDAGQDRSRVTTGDIDCSEVDGPCEYGDDPDLDTFWDGCEDGNPEDCDELAILAPSGSRYEQFGYYCGDRTEEIEDCAAVM